MFRDMPTILRCRVTCVLRTWPFIDFVDADASHAEHRAQGVEKPGSSKSLIFTTTVLLVLCAVHPALLLLDIPGFVWVVSHVKQPTVIDACFDFLESNTLWLPPEGTLWCSTSASSFRFNLAL